MIVTVSLNSGLTIPATDPVTVNRSLLVLLGVPQVAITLEAADIPNASISEAKLANGAVTKAKIATEQQLQSGFVMAYAGASLPDGWLLCDGSAVSRATYADLFTAVGTTHGAGDGSTTFNLPNLADKFVIGKSGTKVLGATGGTETVNLEHSHTLPATTGSTILTGAQSGLPAHYHLWNRDDGNSPANPWGIDTGSANAGPGSFTSIASGTDYRKTSTTVATDAASGHDHTITGPSGNALSTTQTILPPYLALAYLIKT